MTTCLFQLLTREVFFPAVTEQRTQFEYTARVLFPFDGLDSNHTDQFLAACADRGIDILFLVPHSSHQTQRVDVLTFASMKKPLSSSTFSRLENPQSNWLVRILGRGANRVRNVTT
jgi:hypothetical protein